MFAKVIAAIRTWWTNPAAVAARGIDLDALDRARR